ncbi:glycosyltransferase [Brachybacterium muris]|uniref:glycosyltransferase n=1 Tax=Brachybacterium muris TaxID=219301 RepID=UPI0021A7B57D|nr:glycosyltransferase [Brachybacterium muris]MCT1431761.1 glycosyltransferase [Brachybacterium muris]
MSDPTVLIISLSTIVRDPRVLRQISVLSEDYEVHTAGYGPVPEGVHSHLQIPDELRKWRENYRVFYALSATRRFRRLYYGAPWVRFVREHISPGSFDVVLANDASAVPVALALEPRSGVHVDMHEYATRQGEGNRTWERFTQPVVRWIVSTQLPLVDSVTTVSSGLAEEYLREFGVRAEVVPNAARYRPEYSVRPTSSEEPVRLVHTGAAGRGRRIEDMVRAVAEVNEQCPGAFVFDLYLIAGDSAYIEELRSLADELGGGMISIEDPVDYDRIVPTLTQYDVGMFVCPPTTFNLRHALPNKLFEYVQARLAVLIGPSEDMRRYTEKYGFGIVSENFTVQAQVEALRELTPARIDEMKHRAHDAARELDSAKLSDAWRAAVAAIVKHYGLGT